jgi:hypothetical protein
MTAPPFDPLPMDQLADAAYPTDWVWDGLLARGDIALLTGVWKTGKTTLLAGLLRAAGGGFLGRPTNVRTAVVVSEESAGHWRERLAVIPVGPHARLVSRPFPARPTPAAWDDFLARAAAAYPPAGLDLFVVDPLAAFLPGRSESDAGTLLDFLAPLRRLAAGGTAVLVLHHPRKGKTEAGSLARGGGALSGSADTLLELHHVGRGRTGTRRRLLVRSRRAGAADGLVYDWTPGTADFRAVPDDPESRFREDWDAVRGLLAGRPAPATHKELLADWPADDPAPPAAVLYDRLRRAAAAGLAERTGSGTKTDPFRFALPGRGRRSLLPPLPRQ